MKISCGKACEFLKALVYDFWKIDDEVHPVLTKKFNFPEFKLTPNFTEGFQDISLGATNYLG